MTFDENTMETMLAIVDAVHGESEWGGSVSDTPALPTGSPVTYLDEAGDPTLTEVDKTSEQNQRLMLVLGA